MKRLISFLLAMVLLLSAGAAVADEWFCPECGAKNDGNFCPNDGTKRPEKTDTGFVTTSDLKVDSVKLETDGSVTVSWSGGTAPYTVRYQYYVNENHNANVDVILWKAADNIYGNKGTYEYDFVPGERYWVIVSDANNNEAWYDYSEYVRAFSRANCSYFFTLRTKRNNRSAKVDYFSARDIKAEFSSNLFGANIKVTPTIKQEMTIVFRMGIILPSGEPILIHVERGTIKPRRGSYYMWENYNFKYLWNTLMETKGSIPSGTYTFKLFFDNEYLFEQPFPVND